MHVQVHHVMLVGIKSKERAATQADLCKFLQNLRAWALRYSVDASDLLLSDTKLFDDDAVLQAEHRKWATHGSMPILIANLFIPDPDTRDVAIQCLQAEMCAIVDELDANSGQYLQGGKIATLFDPNTPQTEDVVLRREHFLHTPLSTDYMESLYGFLDYDLTLNKNLTVKTGSGMAAWRFNEVGEWIETLHPELADIIWSLARYFADETHNERRDNLDAAHAGKLQSLLDKEAANEKSRKVLLKNMLKLSDIEVFMTLDAWLIFKRAAGPAGEQRDRKLLSTMRMQFQCLRYRAGMKFSLIPRLTRGRVDYPVNVIVAQYENLLRKIERNEIHPKPVVRGIEERLIRKATAFRTGKLSKGWQETVRYDCVPHHIPHTPHLYIYNIKVQRRREKYQKEIEDVKTELVKSQMQASKGRVRSKKGQRVYPDFTGRQVAVPSEYFNLPGEIYFGTVVRWCKYTSGGGEQLWGYDIHYNAGDKWYMIEEDVSKYVKTVDGDDHLNVNVNDNSTKPDEVVSDSSDTDVDDTSCTSGESGGYDDSESDDSSSENHLIIDVLGGEDVENELYLNDGVKPDWMT